MPSNRTYVCVPCRSVNKYPMFNKDWEMMCRFCKGPLTSLYKWSAPKKNDDRMWKRIEAGEWYWNRHKRQPSKGTSWWRSYRTNKPRHDLGS